MRPWDIQEAVKQTVANPAVTASHKTEVADHIKTALGVLGYLSYKGVGFFKKRKIRKAIETLREVSEVIANEQT